MFAHGKSKAEQQLAQSERRIARAEQEKKDALRQKSEQTARLRAMRLAKEAADKAANG